MLGRLTAALAIAPLLLAGCLGSQPQAAPDPAGGPDGGPPGGAAAPGNGTPPFVIPIETQTVCFNGDFTRNLPRMPIVLAGTLFRPLNLTNATRAIVLVHGFASNATNTFDGGPAAYGVANQTTLARTLARAGYAVIAADRLGMGNNPYPDGRQLTIQSYAELTAGIVAQLKAGSYHTSTAACPAQGPAPFKASSVVVGGHSFGGLIAQTYFQSSDEAAGLLSLDLVHALSQGTVAAWSDCLSRAVVTNPQSGYWASACTREYCLQIFFNVPGYDAASVDHLCDPARQIPDSQGSLMDLQYHFGTMPARLQRGGPVFLLYAECAGSFNTPPCDAKPRDMETKSWENLCPSCTVSDHVLPGVAHAYMYYPAANTEANRVILEWLAASGLGPTVG